MKFGVLGTGMVGDAIASKLVELGHEVMMGSRTPTNDKAAKWVARFSERASQGTFADAATFGDMVFNCTNGAGALEALRAAGAASLANKILVDVANPLDFSNGMPPTLLVCNTDSLGEQIQRTFPDTRVVKTLNTVNCEVMVDASKVAGDHTLFMCGNHPEAKEQVHRLLVEEFGWRDIVDLGDITAARGTESLLPLWIRLWQTLGTATFNFKVVRDSV